VQVFGLTAPLLLDSSGHKMGKTASGEKIWLDPALTTPYAFFQYWRNVDDADAPRLLRLFSLRPLAELDELVRAHDMDRAKRLAQVELARTLTGWVHGAGAVAEVDSASADIFSGELAGMTDADLVKLAGTVPTIEIARAELAGGLAIIDLIARTVENSKGAARRLITQGGAYLNNVKVSDVDRTVTLADLATETMLLVRKGKRDVRLVRVT
jgi:tyrosyl-tRNA synthetase